MKKRLLPLVMICAAIITFSLPAASQTLITIGTGTTANAGNAYPAPYGNFFFGARHQFIILATELNAAGMNIAGDINSLAFNVATPQGAPLSGFTISMKNTTSPTVGTTFETGTSTVFGPATVTESAGWNTHTFSTPFSWDGTSNILVETCFNNTNWTQNAQTYYTTTSFISAGYFRADVNNVCSQNTVTQSTNRPNMRFDYAPANVPPIADFTVSTQTSCTGVIDFFDNSQNTPTSWLWDFGDSNTSTAQNPSHTYTSSGTYTIQLTACNANGCDTKTETNYITVNLAGGSTPIAASCTPSTTSYCCGFGITSVNLNTINNGSSDGIAGYEDFTCQSTTLFTGSSYTLDVATPGGSTHNAAAWIDYNNDGVFTEPGERIMTSSSALSHTANFTVPGTAVTGTPLRLRISADYDFSNPPTACSNLDYGQAEDYTIVLQTNTSPPAPDFTVSDTITCSGMVQFTDLTTNLPTSWSWNFGDGNFSNQQNASHTYTASGTYSVTLTATNANGSNSITYTNLITVNLAGQLTAPSCTPNTLAYCCGYGIFNVNLNTLNYTTGNASEGYQDYSCTQSTQLTEGATYPISVTTGSSANQDTKVWIDFNNDGVFDNATELVLNAPNTINPSGNITVPGGVTLNTPIRMRVSSDFVGSTLNPCSNLTYGQAEDYAVTIQQNLSPPVAAFSSDSTIVCAGTVNFVDQSTNGPTSWLWDFGDSNTSTLQNPTHTYANPGNYTVTLTATNANGSDTEVQAGYISYNPGLCSEFNINVFGTQTTTLCAGTLYDNGGQFGNYSNNTDGLFIIQPTNAISVSVQFTFFDLVASFGGDTIYVYDGNNINAPLLGAFSANPLPNGGAPITSSAGVIAIRQLSDNNTTDPGFALNWSCVTGTPLPPVADFTASQTSVCETQCVVFSDASTSTAGGITSWLWTFPGANVTSSTQQNPTACYSTAGTYDVTLSVTDFNGTHDTTFVDYITVTTGGNCDTILIADFTASDTEVCSGDCIDFTDMSFSNSGGATSWLWAFPGGSPNSSTAQNPTVCYNNPGTYSVTLLVNDVNGSHDTTIVDLITVLDPNACDTVSMPTTGTGPTLTSCEGTLVDDGGAFGNYSDNSNGTMTVAPPSALPIQIDFSAFNFETNFDYVRIYDGLDDTQPLLGEFTGATLPPSLIATSGAFTVKQTSDFGINESGFMLTWSCLTDIEEPDAGISMNLFPNPTNEGFTVAFATPQVQDQVTITISNALGQTVQTIDVMNTSSFNRWIDATSFQPGIYFVTLTHSNGQTVRRLIVE